MCFFFLVYISLSHCAQLIINWLIDWLIDWLGSIPGQGEIYAENSVSAAHPTLSAVMSRPGLYLVEGKLGGEGVTGHRPLSAGPWNRRSLTLSTPTVTVFVHRCTFTFLPFTINDIYVHWALSCAAYCNRPCLYVCLWVRLTTASAQYLRRLWALFHCVLSRGYDTAIRCQCQMIKLLWLNRMKRCRKRGTSIVNFSANTDGLVSFLNSIRRLRKT